MSAEDISKKVRDKIGEDVDPASIENYLQSKGAFPAPSVSSDSVSLASVGVSAFSNAMERDIESALLSQLDSLGLRLFVDESGRNGQQYFAGEFGRIDLLTTDSNGDFVVIELKREDVPARQLAGLPVTSLLSGRTLPSQKVVQLLDGLLRDLHRLKRMASLKSLQMQ